MLITSLIDDPKIRLFVGGLNVLTSSSSNVEDNTRRQSRIILFREHVPLKRGNNSITTSK